MARIEKLNKKNTESGKLGVILIVLRRIGSKKLLFVTLVGLVILLSAEVLYAEKISSRDSQIEAFLAEGAEGKGMWLATYPINGKELFFIFTNTGHYCGWDSLDWRGRSCGDYWVYIREEGGYYLQLKELSGKLFKMILEIKESYLIRINGRDLKS